MKGLWVGIVVVAAIAFQACVSSSGLPEPIFSLPKGDAAAGKQAFAKFSCYSCHQAVGEGFPEQRGTIDRAATSVPK